jgi:hypothetical protein
MFWPTLTVIVAAFIIIAFLIPVFAAVLFGTELARFMAEARRERMAPAVARRPLALKTSGPVCPWEPGRSNDEFKRAA